MQRRGVRTMESSWENVSPLPSCPRWKQESVSGETKLSKATRAFSHAVPSKSFPGAWRAAITHRYADFPQDLFRNSFGFFQHLIQRATILK